MPKAKVEEKEMPVEEEPAEEAKPEAVPEVPETPQPEIVAKPKARAKVKAAPKVPAPKAESKVDLKQKHTCGQCGKTMSLHTALYNHKCPGDVSIPQPPALVRQTNQAPEPAAPAPLPPQYSHAQLIRMQLAQAAQERRAQARLRMTAPIRHFYGM